MKSKNTLATRVSKLHGNFSTVANNTLKNHTKSDVLKPKRDGFSMDLGAEINMGKRVNNSAMDQFFLELNGTANQMKKHEQIIGDFYENKQFNKTVDSTLKNRNSTSKYNTPS